ncbi:MAG: hypothetical protein R6U57_08475 [Anaerolineales bacterium]
MKHKLLIVLFLLLLLSGCGMRTSLAVTPPTDSSPSLHSTTHIACREILPSDTDPAIMGWNEPHYVCHPGTPNPESARLFVFLPGTGATPDYYTHLMEASAEAGLYVIDLRYPNDKSVNLQLCPRDPDPNCHEKIRAEIVEGDALSPRVTVDPANSIEGRLRSALLHLREAFPGEGWEQFLNGKDEVVWSSVVVSGHSQGGGHATYLAYLHHVDHAVLFSWADVRRGDLAPWLVENPSQTPPEDYYLFWHEGDEGVARFQGELMRVLGIDTFGEPVMVDTSEPPYQGSHALIATIPPPAGERAHNTHVADKALIFNAEGEPIYEGVWQYLLTLEIQDEPSVDFPQNEIQTGNAVPIGAPSQSYIDPEFYSDENLITFVDGQKRAWLGSLNPEDGYFLSADGKDILIDNNLTQLSLSFNAPEFGIDRDGWALYYTKDYYGVPQIWRGTLTEGGLETEVLTRDETTRLSALASKDPTLETTHLLYAQGGFSPEVGKIAWLDEADPRETETTVAPIDRGARWIDGTPSFVFVERSGPDAGQVALHDTETGRTKTITDTEGKKRNPYGWFAPEYQDILVLVVVEDSRIEIYRDTGGAYWERIITLEIPPESPYSVIGSPEPFVAGGTSYISLVAKASPVYAEGEVWVWGIAEDQGRFQLRCEDGQGEVIRSDPESYLGEGEVFIYYNVIQPDVLGRQAFDLFKCSTGISP